VQATGVTAVPEDRVPGSKVLLNNNKTLTNFALAIAGVVVVVALAVITASARMTEREINRAVAERDAANRFLADELSGLRLMAMSSESPVPARLYLGIEECFKRSVAVPFGSAEAARGTVAACAEMELGRLHAQGGAAMADKGRGVLVQVGLKK
jgi:hypothetical protein